VFVRYICCVWSGFCDELITRSGEWYRARACVCAIECNLETSTLRRPRSVFDCCVTKKLKG